MHRVVAILLVLFVAACGSAAAGTDVESQRSVRTSDPSANNSAPRILLATGAYIDGPMRLAYFTNEDSRVEAVDIATGETRWTNPDFAMVLRADDGAVLALKLGNPFQASVLDPGTSVTLHDCDAVALPPWTGVAAHDGLGSSFRLEVRERGTQTYAEWQASTHYAGGAAPSPDMLAQASRNQSGFVSIAFDHTHCVAREVESVPTEGRAGSLTTPLFVGEVEITFAVLGDGSITVSALDTSTSTSRWHRTLASPFYAGPFPP